MIPGELDRPLRALADAYEQHLFVVEHRRLAHHFAHVAPETWLSLELAFVVNQDPRSFGLPGWTAVVERAKVDVTLVAPTEGTRPTRFLHVEVKLCAPEYWSGWPLIYQDLIGRANKPRADLLVCFVIEATETARRWKSTVEKYRDYLSRIPTGPGEFSPIEGHPPFRLLSSTKTHQIRWEKPVYDMWPQGYSANVRMIWLGLPQPLTPVGPGPAAVNPI